MGQILCSKHGRQSGPICCEHVVAAMDQNAPLPEGVAVTFTVQLTDDSSIPFEFVVCSICAADGRLHSGAAFSERHTGEAELPVTFPICGRCLESWRGCKAATEGANAP
jgi:hypothetical protein